MKKAKAKRLAKKAAKQAAKQVRKLAKQAERESPVALLSKNGKLIISEESVSEARQVNGVPIHAIFAPYTPPSFVAPADAMAMDNVMAYSGWATNSVTAAFGGILADGLTFMGYPYLAQLAQRAEYRVIVETIAGEMTRKWIKFKASADESSKQEKIKAIDDEFIRLKVRDKFRKAGELDGFFGRSHIYFNLGTTEDHDEIATDMGDGWNEATKGKVGEGGLKGLVVIEPSWTYASDYNSTDPLREDWYKPKTWYVMGVRVHTSRILTFAAREVPDLLKPAYMFGGLSLTQMAKPYVEEWIRTKKAVSQIVYNYSVNVLKTQMGDVLQGKASSSLVKRAKMFTDIKSNQGLMILDNDSEDFLNVSTPLGGLNELQAQAQEHVASVARIPLVKLTGISPSGLNASSEGEIKVFYDFIHDCQESHFREPLTKVLGIVQYSLFGEVDPDIDFDFLPLEEMSDKEKIEMWKLKADAEQVLVGIGSIGPEDSRKRVATDPDTPYVGLDVDDLPNMGGGATEEQWAAALGVAPGESGQIADPQAWAKALGGIAGPAEADNALSGASPEQWASALGEPSAAPVGASRPQWEKALEEL